MNDDSDMRRIANDVLRFAVDADLDLKPMDFSLCCVKDARGIGTSLAPKLAGWIVPTAHVDTIALTLSGDFVVWRDLPIVRLPTTRSLLDISTRFG